MKPIATVHRIDGNHKTCYSQKDLDDSVKHLQTFDVPFFVCLHGKDVVNPLKRHQTHGKPPTSA